MDTDVKILLSLIAENDDQLAFTKLYKHYLPGLLSFVNSILKDRHCSEEVILNVFLKIWENRKSLSAITNFPNYLYVIAKHAALNSLRDRKIVFVELIEESIPFTFISAEEALISKESLETISSAINKLPPRCKLIFRLIREEKLKYSEVANLLGISVKTVEAQMSIANKKLSELFKILHPGIQIKYSG